MGQLAAPMQDFTFLYHLFFLYLFLMVHFPYLVQNFTVTLLHFFHFLRPLSLSHSTFNWAIFPLKPMETSTFTFSPSSQKYSFLVFTLVYFEVVLWFSEESSRGTALFVSLLKRFQSDSDSHPPLSSSSPSDSRTDWPLHISLSPKESLLAD